MFSLKDFLVCLLWVFSLLPSDSRARQSEQNTDEALYRNRTLLDASMCSDLFGNNQTHDSNRTARQENLVSIRRYSHATVIVHHTNWDQPRYVEYPGIDLVDTTMFSNHNTHPVAYIEITERLNKIDCTPGIYTINVDDAIGKKTKVLAILEDLVLIERDDELLYLASDPNLEKPHWQMVWASPWKIIKTPESSKSSSVRSPTPTRRHQTPRKHHRSTSGRSGRR